VPLALSGGSERGGLSLTAAFMTRAFVDLNQQRAARRSELWAFGTRLVTFGAAMRALKIFSTAMLAVLLVVPCCLSSGGKLAAARHELRAPPQRPDGRNPNTTLQAFLCRKREELAFSEFSIRATRLNAQGSGALLS